MWTRAILVILLASVSLLGADWNPKLAAQYLDARQKKWFDWKQAASPDGPCVSCHTGLPYLLARPALRRVLGEKQPTSYETGLLDRLRSQAGAKPAAALQGVETVFAALFLAQQDSGGASLSAPTRQTFDQLWSLQAHDGNLKGASLWYSAGLDPWETPAASYYGTALAALAVGATPAAYRSIPENQEHIRALEQYLRTGWQDRPLHSRLALLWASTKLPQLLTEPERKALVAEVLRKQQPDGGWTVDSLGPWTAHPGAPPSDGSNSYATAFAAYVLGRAGASSPKALQWLKAHQDRSSGSWPAASMNKHYPFYSMQVHFMEDAATAFAALTLVEAGQ